MVPPSDTRQKTGAVEKDAHALSEAAKLFFSCKKEIKKKISFK